MAEEKKIPPYSKGCFQGIKDSREPATIQDFLDDLKKQGYQEDLTVDDFLKFSDGHQTNAEVIVDTYSSPMREKYKSEIKQGKPPVIIVGTRYAIPNKQITAELQEILASDLFLRQDGGFSAFWSEKKTELESDKDGYIAWDVPRKDSDSSVPINDSRANQKRNRETPLGSGNENEEYYVQLKSLNVRVWVYSHALGKVYDISSWIRTCSTNKDMSMGTFSIELVPTDTLTIQTFGEDFANHFNITDKRGSINRDWFSKFIQYNDMVFIRFEKLKAEKYEDQGKMKSSSHIIEPSELNNKLIWDMMGLVDTVETSVDSENTDYSVNISGRDLTKLLVEDGSYFIPLKFVEGSPDRWFYGGDPESSWFKRNMVTGSYDYYFAYEFQQIDLVSAFIIDHLSNIGIIPDSIFSHCAIRPEARGVWKMIKMFVDSQLSDRRIVDRSLTNPEGTLMDFFNKICQQPFVEFWGDTWGSEYDFVARQPPFTKEAISSVVKKGEYIGIEPKDLLSYSLGYDNRVYSWYRLMPQNALTGSSQFSSLALVPIIFLNEYVERFGNKRCITNDIYLSEKSLKGKNDEKNINTMSQALLNDLLYVVETTCYLPFTRKGTITINGDRRIKVGTFVILESTQELFYVTAVNNTITFTNDVIDRVTVLTVERGMLLEFIPSSASGMGITYFDVVNIEGIRADIQKRDPKHKDDVIAPSSTKFGVNSEIFEFFLKRDMFKDGND
jgi:hypothetical protein